ncbi:hypothetical protein BDP27DRAFT_1428390 [Rhodocollybia butyracea]|uniref:Uncharacterized protein n=1 Tax=Rhodocollybia butyracea TaxID=206335 RepID=A0A9P5U1V4_9AGAR|nr:hypothetical protein BDP27DRAFT_1428390 [Rhodocollybia butyracea]
MSPFKKLKFHSKSTKNDANATTPASAGPNALRCASSPNLLGTGPQAPLYTVSTLDDLDGFEDLFTKPRPKDNIKVPTIKVSPPRATPMSPLDAMYVQIQIIYRHVAQLEAELHRLQALNASS